MDFNDILSDKPLPAPVEETDEKPAEPEVPEKEPEAPAEPAAPSAAKAEEPAAEAKAPEVEDTAARDDKGRFVKTVPHEALHAERQRRMELEARIQELEKLDKQPPAPPKAPTSVLEDEDKAFNERLTQATAPLVQRLFKMSVAYARKVPGREDYQEVYDFLNEESKKDPSIIQQLDAAEDPGEFIYQLGKTRKELAAVGNDLTKYREHAVASERAKYEQSLQQLQQQYKAAQAELEALKKSKEKREAIPQSLNSEPSAPMKGEQFAGPTPMKNILNS